MQQIPLDLHSHLPYQYIFNPSIAQSGEGYILVFRLQNHPHEGLLGYGELTPDFQIKDRPSILPLPNFLSERLGLMLEDPRIFTANGQLYLNYVIANASYFYLICTALGKIDAGKQVVDNRVIDYKKNRLAFDQMLKLGKNEKEIYLPQQQWLVEKNWQFFVQERDFYCVYEAGSRHLVVQFDEQNGKRLKEWVTYYSLDWNFGRISGGASPVLVGDYFYCFFHSWTPWDKPDAKKDLTHRKYHMGVYTFENKKPFKMVSISAAPLISASENDGNYPSGHAVIFPGGALYDQQKKEWIISIGRNDVSCEIIKFSHQEITQSLVNVKSLSSFQYHIKEIGPFFRSKLRSIKLKMNSLKKGV